MRTTNKTIMRTLKTMLYAFMATALMFTLSCSPEDGKDGAQGPQGEQGLAGQDGVDGQDGTNGQDGNDGEDGNANVTTHIFTPGPQFQADNTNSYTAVLPDVTDSDLLGSAWLGYLIYESTSSENITYVPVPGQFSAGFPIAAYDWDFFWDDNDSETRVHVQSLPSASGINTKVDFDAFHVVQIESNNTTNNKMASQENSLTPIEQVKAELKAAGVDINDYHAVCDYYDIPY